MSDCVANVSASKLADAIDRAVLALSRHWLSALLAYGTLLTALPAVAPMLKAAGYSYLSSPIYFAYQFICHQRADRSFHVHGEQMAFCARDLAIFAGAVGIAGVYGLARRLRPISSPHYLLVLLALVPIGLDGVTQIIGLRESTTVLRISTGVIFSIGIGWYLLPRLDSGFSMLEIDIRNRPPSRPDPALAGTDFRKA
jgi:uncharacterized membrane protein